MTRFSENSIADAEIEIRVLLVEIIVHIEDALNAKLAGLSAGI